MTRHAVLAGVDGTPLRAATYQPHALHADDVVWVEKNCYIDIWIELVHALGLDPMAMLPFTAAVDFEADQWTFFKPPHTELWSLYGIDVQELTVWRPLVDQAVDYLAQGKLISTEADAFWLPDTAGTDYQTQHTKTTIIIADIDREARRLGYFHNAGYHELGGEDFVQLLRVGAEPDPTFMPLYAELVRIDRVVRRPAGELAAMAAASLAEHLGRRPVDNPVSRFASRLDAELAQLADEGLETYHLWAFATIRQMGAAFELQAMFLRWLGAQSGVELDEAAAAFDEINQGGKTLILKAARAVNRKRAFDGSELLGPMAAAWDRGMAILDDADLGARVAS